MKTINKFLLIGLLIASPILYQGCGSTPVATANNSNALLITSVNTGMTTWAGYVNSGKATQAQINAVKSYYNTYYNAELVVKAALETSVNTTNSNAADLATASSSVTVAETALLNMLNQYLNNK